VQVRSPPVRRLAIFGVVALLAGCRDDGPEPDRAAFCERLGRLTENDPFLAFGDTATAAEIEEGFEALVARADELATVAPDEVRPAAEAYATSARAMDELMDDAGYVGGRVDARAYRYEQEAYTEAADRLLRYLEVEC
jgi:hypothetical protein